MHLCAALPLSYIPHKKPSGVNWGSVSCPRTFSTIFRDWDRNAKPLIRGSPALLLSHSRHVCNPLKPSDMICIHSSQSSMNTNKNTTILTFSERYSSKTSWIRNLRIKIYKKALTMLNFKYDKRLSHDWKIIIVKSKLSVITDIQIESCWIYWYWQIFTWYSLLFITAHYIYINTHFICLSCLLFLNPSRCVVYSAVSSR